MTSQKPVRWQRPRSCRRRDRLRNRWQPLQLTRADPATAARYCGRRVTRLDILDVLAAIGALQLLPENANATFRLVRDKSNAEWGANASHSAEMLHRQWWSARRLANVRSTTSSSRRRRSLWRSKARRDRRRRHARPAHRRGRGRDRRQRLDLAAEQTPAVRTAGCVRRGNGRARDRGRRPQRSFCTTRLSTTPTTSSAEARTPGSAAARCCSSKPCSLPTA